MTQGSPLLAAHDLIIVTGARINIAVPAGTVHCISGASGSGKTRLLRALADLDPVSGDVSLAGTSRMAITPSDWRRQVMLNPAQPRWWLETVQAHCMEDVAQWGEQLHLPADRLQAPIDQLSTGEQARAGLLRALSWQPTVLLLDEPTGALDGKSARAVEELLKAWLTPERAILWVSHDPAQIERIGDSHSVLDHQGLHPQ